MVSAVRMQTLLLPLMSLRHHSDAPRAAFDTTMARERCKLRWFQQPECKPGCSFWGAYDTAASGLEPPDARDRRTMRGFRQPGCKPCCSFWGTPQSPVSEKHAQPRFRSVFFRQNTRVSEARMPTFLFRFGGLRDQPPEAPRGETEPRRPHGPEIEPRRPQGPEIEPRRVQPSTRLEQPRAARGAGTL